MGKEYHILDATNCNLGRIASVAAKLSLLGNKVDIVNAEKALVSTSRLAKYDMKVTELGTRDWGPFFPRVPHLLVKRTIRGMLPWKSSRGREAYKRIRVFTGVPGKLEGKSQVRKDLLIDSDIMKHITVEELSKRIGNKW